MDRTHCVAWNHGHQPIEFQRPKTEDSSTGVRDRLEVCFRLSDDSATSQGVVRRRFNSDPIHQPAKNPVLSFGPNPGIAMTRPHPNRPSLSGSAQN